MSLKQNFNKYLPLVVGTGLAVEYSVRKLLGYDFGLESTIANNLDALVATGAITYSRQFFDLMDMSYESRKSSPSKLEEDTNEEILLI